jgi:hypothetical protein
MEQVHDIVYEHDNKASLETRDFLRGEGTSDSTTELVSHFKIFTNSELLQGTLELKWE